MESIDLSLCPLCFGSDLPVVENTGWTWRAEDELTVAQVEVLELTVQRWNKQPTGKDSGAY